MEIEPRVQFDDTGTAFSYKSDRQLRKANFIFTVVNNPVMSAIATRLATIALKLRVPGVKAIIRSTIFEHFCGGETIEASEKTIVTLKKFNVGTILDYSVEGEKTEEGFDDTTAEILRTLEKAKRNTPAKNSPPTKRQTLQRSTPGSNRFAAKRMSTACLC